MRKIIFLGLLNVANLIYAQNFEWVRTGSGIGQDTGHRITTGASGNVYATGSFSDAAKFSGQNVSGSGIFEIYIAKYSPSGDLLWLKSAGSYQNDEGLGIATDSEENVYVTGYFSEICLFGQSPNSVTLVSGGRTDIFLAKYNSNGDLQWAVKAGGQGEDRGNNLKIDAGDNIYLTGYFSEHGYFGNEVVVSKGSADVFTARYDASGNCMWARSLGGVGLDKSFGIATDTFGNAYITGFFYYGATLSNSGAVLSADGLSSDIFVVGYNSNGDNILAKRIGGYFNDAGFGIAVDEQKNIYVTGYFLDEITFGSYYMNSYGYDDIFVVKYDSTFTAEWALHEGSVHLDIGLDIALDKEGNIYVTGMYDSVGYFGNDTLFSASYYDLFVTKYNSKGIPLWVEHAGGIEGDFSKAICVGDDGSIYLTGYYKNVAYFGDHTAAFSKENDIFIAKMSQPTVGIRSVSRSDLTFQVYPNPNKGTFFIYLNERSNENITAKLFDLSGKLIKQEILKSNWSRTISFNVNNLVPGTYLLQLTGNSRSQSERIIIF